MANDTIQSASRRSSPDPVASEENSSVQVQYDGLSSRGQSRERRSHSPSARPSTSRRPDPSSPLVRQATANSLSSLLSSQSSSQPSSQPSQGDRAAPEDVLRDLIAVTQSGANAVLGTLQGVKRPHDSEAASEPVPKRDKLVEELDRMAPPRPANDVAVAVSAPVSTSSGVPVSNSAAATTERPASDDGARFRDARSRSAAAPRASVIFRARTSRRRLPPPPQQLGAGTGRTGPVIADDNCSPAGSRGDDSDIPSDGQDV